MLMIVDDFLASWTVSLKRPEGRSFIHWFPTGIENRSACNRRAADYFDGFRVEPASKLTSPRMCMSCLNRLKLVTAGRASDPSA